MARTETATGIAWASPGATATAVSPCSCTSSRSTAGSSSPSRSPGATANHQPGGRSSPAHNLERNQTMTTVHHSHSLDNLSGLVATLQQYADAGIDPAFDDGLEELERQFAELRLTREA